MQLCVPGRDHRFSHSQENHMHRFGLLAGAALGLTLIIAAVRADEEKIGLDKVPRPVLDAVKAKFPEAKLSGAAKETEGGKTIFEVAFTFKGHKYEVECNPDGTFVAIDKQIEATDLPAAVAKALKEKYPHAKYKVIEEVTKNDKIAEYEVELTTSDNKSVEVVFDPSGKLLKQEKKEEKK
jgi:uncharacterized membrane protein YkoI